LRFPPALTSRLNSSLPARNATQSVAGGFARRLELRFMAGATKITNFTVNFHFPLEKKKKKKYNWIYV